MIYTFTGKNRHALQAELTKRINAFMNAHGEMAIERIDASEIDASEIISRASNLPFLAPKKLVVIRSSEQNAQLLEKIETLLERTPDSIDVILCGEFDKRKSYYKQLKKLTELRDFKEENPRDLSGWASEYAKEQGAELTKADAMYLVERVGGDQQLLAREIEKLAIGGEKITRKHIDTLTDETIEASIFALLDEVFSGNEKAALQRYRQQRAARVDPHYIIAMLSWQLQQLASVVFAADPAEIKNSGVSPYTASKLQKMIRSTSITKKDVRQYICMLSETDSHIKNSVGVDTDAALENYILTISSR